MTSAAQVAGDAVRAEGGAPPALVVARSVVAWVVAALGAAIALGVLVLATQRSVLEDARLELSSAQLEARAREVIVGTTGRAAGADHTASGFEYPEDYLAYLDLIPDLAERRRTRAAGPAPLVFWYRQSPRPLLPVIGSGLPELGFETPPVGREGEIALRLDAEGRLVELRRWPRASEPRQREDAWDPVFAAAELERARFRDLHPRFVPLVPADELFEWAGSAQRFPAEELEVEGASVAGRPTWFRYSGAWSTRVPPPVHDLSTLPRGALLLLTLILTAAALWHHRTGRGDPASDRRLALAAGGVALLVAIGSPVRFARAADAGSLLAFSGYGLAFGVAVWVCALALGPRLDVWPRMTVAWRRLWRRDRDGGRGVVASAILVGAFAGCLLALLHGLAWAVPVWLGRTAIETRPPVGGLAGGWATVEAILSALARALLWTGLIAFGLELGRMVLRVRLLAALAAAAAVLVLHSPGSGIGWLVVSVYALLWISVLVRWGLLASLVAAFVDQLSRLPLTTRLDHWTAQTTWAVLAIVGALLLGAAFSASRSARRVQAGEEALAR